MNALLLVGAGGFVGSIVRYLMSTALMRTAATAFPYGTLAVNVVGCFLIGMLAARTNALSNDARLLLMTGVLGGFTTFSAFGLETVNLLRKGAWVMASGYVAASVIGGMLAVMLGLYVMGQRV